MWSQLQERSPTALVFGGHFQGGSSSLGAQTDPAGLRAPPQGSRARARPPPSHAACAPEAPLHLGGLPLGKTARGGRWVQRPRRVCPPTGTCRGHSARGQGSVYSLPLRAPPWRGFNWRRAGWHRNTTHGGGVKIHAHSRTRVHRFLGKPHTVTPILTPILTKETDVTVLSWPKPKGCVDSWPGGWTRSRNQGPQGSFRDRVPGAAVPGVATGAPGPPPLATPLTLRCRRAGSTGAFLLVKPRLQPPAQQQGWTPSAWPPQASGSPRSLSAWGAVGPLPVPPLLFPDARPRAFKHSSSSVSAHPQSRRPLCRVC